MSGFTSMSQLRRMMVSASITSGMAIRAHQRLPDNLVDEFFRYAGEEGLGELCLTLTDEYKLMADWAVGIEACRGSPEAPMAGERIVRSRDGLESVARFMMHRRAPDTAFRKVFREILSEFDELFRVPLLQCHAAFECFVDLRGEMIQKGVLEYENERLWWTRMADDVQAVLMDKARESRAEGFVGEAIA